MCQTRCISTVAVKVSDLNALNVEELTKAEMEGRKQSFEYERFFRDKVQGYEEQRRLTLSRIGKLVERVLLHNHQNAGNIQDYNALLPIPASEIEANRDAVLEQNPGYIQ